MTIFRIFSFATLVVFANFAQAYDYHYNCQFHEGTGTTTAAASVARNTHPSWEFGFAFVLNQGQVAKLRKLQPYEANNHEHYYDGVGTRGLDLPGPSDKCEHSNFPGNGTTKVPTTTHEACFDDLRFADGNGTEGGWVLIVPKNFLGKNKASHGEIKVTRKYDGANSSQDGFQSEVYSCKLIQ